MCSLMGASVVVDLQNAFAAHSVMCIGKFSCERVKWPSHNPIQTPICCFYRSKDSPINSIKFYGKELTCHEAMDSLVCFNQQS